MTDTTAGWLLSGPGTAAAAGTATLLLVLLLAVITVRVRRDRASAERGYASRHAADRPASGTAGADPRVFTPGRAGVPGPPRFVCPRCGAASSDPGDLEHGYCGRCHAFTGGQLPAPGEAR